MVRIDRVGDAAIEQLLAHCSHGASPAPPAAAAAARQCCAHEFQIHPGLALLARAAQQIGRMIGHDQRRALRAEAMHLAAQTADAAYRSPAGSARRCGRPPASAAAASARSAAAGYGRQAADLGRPRVAVAGRPALEDIGDVHVLARLSPMARSIELSSCPARPTNGSPCRSSSAPGASPITSHSRLRIADAEYRLGAGPVQLAAGAARDLARAALPRLRPPRPAAARAQCHRRGRTRRDGRWRDAAPLQRRQRAAAAPSVDAERLEVARRGGSHGSAHGAAARGGCAARTAQAPPQPQQRRRDARSRRRSTSSTIGGSLRDQHEDQRAPPPAQMKRTGRVQIELLEARVAEAAHHQGAGQRRDARRPGSARAARARAIRSRTRRRRPRWPPPTDSAGPRSSACRRGTRGH